MKKEFRKLPKGYKVDSELSRRYENDPIFFKQKLLAEEVLKKVGVPKGW